MDIKRWLRFLISGALNTSVTYLLYLFLNIFLEYQLAYFLSYFSGIILSYWLNSVIVFKVSLSWKKFFSFPLVYVVQYLIAALILRYTVTQLNIAETIAPLMTIVITLPITYAISRFILANKK
jgi:putative flippase GtrA